MVDKDRLFDEALRRNGLGARSGAASLSVIKQAFGEMASELHRLNASDAERDAFVAAITRAINEEAKLTSDDKDALKGVLQSAFNAMQPEAKVAAVKCNFLGRVSL